MPAAEEPNASAIWEAVMTTAEGQRHSCYAELLTQAPVHRTQLPNGATGWLITGHAETRRLLTDPRISKRGPELAPYATQMPPALSAAIHSHMLQVDPPEHTRLRKLVTKAFTRRMVDALKPEIELIADTLLNTVEAAGTQVIDLISTFAYPLPIAVISTMLGIPDERRADFQEWAATITTPETAGLARYTWAAEALLGYARQLTLERRVHPAGDLLSSLLAIRDHEDWLSEDELTSMVFLLVVAGHETTVNLIANGILALLSNPLQAGFLRTHPEQVDGVIEELLRYDGPVHNTPAYVVTEPTAVDGHVLQPDDLIFFTLLAANRDPARYTAPDRLDFSREHSAHLAFGHGIHHCLGAPLARLEARVALHAVTRRFPRLSLAVPAEQLTRNPSVLMNSLKALPVRLRVDLRP